MRTVRTITELRGMVHGWRTKGERIAFVPTMGNLHAGHIHLMAQAAHRADRVLASIFVNPMQFGVNEDFSAYPRTLTADSIALAENGVHALFAPEVPEIYPHGMKNTTRVEAVGLSDILCGASRPGHFVGVATVVNKFFNIVQPDIAVFGEKDYQQLLVIRRMVADLCLPITILGVPTVREPDGLAMSSRNGYLTAEQRSRASGLYQVLRTTHQKITEGARDYAMLAEQGMQSLRDAGFTPDYFTVRRSQDLMLPELDDSELVVLAAAWLGSTRLIDNMKIEI